MADSVGTLPLGALRQLDSQQRGGRQRVRERGAGRHTARPLGREKQPARGCGAGSRPDDGDGGGNAGNQGRQMVKGIAKEVSEGRKPIKVMKAAKSTKAISV